jgi:hypothetical protein
MGVLKKIATKNQETIQAWCLAQEFACTDPLSYIIYWHSHLIVKRVRFYTLCKVLPNLLNQKERTVLHNFIGCRWSQAEMAQKILQKS